MKLKSLLALALILTTVGLSLPAAADDRDGSNRDRSDRVSQNKKRHQYQGKYHYYKLSDSSYIYVGERGDYWDDKRNYHSEREHPEYKQYYQGDYDWSKGNYYDGEKYYPNKQSRNNDQKYYGKYHYHKLSDSSYIYIGEHGDYWDDKRSYHSEKEHPEYKQYYQGDYDWSKGNYYESGRYYGAKEVK